MITIPETVAPIEVLWTVIAFVCLYNHLRYLWYSYGDYLFQKARGLNGGRRIVVIESVRRHGLYAVAQLAFIFAGLVSMSLPQSTTPAQSTGFWVGLAIIVAELVFLINSIADNNSRDHLLAYLGGRRYTDASSDHQASGPTDSPR